MQPLSITTDFLLPSLLLVLGQDHPVLGPCVFFLVVVIFAIICVPESILTIGGGYIFGRTHGLALGMLLCVSVTFGGALCGSLISFCVARYLIQGTVQASCA